VSERVKYLGKVGKHAGTVLDRDGLFVTLAGMVSGMFSCFYS